MGGVDEMTWMVGDFLKKGERGNGRDVTGGNSGKTVLL